MCRSAAEDVNTRKNPPETENREFNDPQICSQTRRHPITRVMWRHPSFREKHRDPSSLFVDHVQHLCANVASGWFNSAHGPEWRL